MNFLSLVKGGSQMGCPGSAGMYCVPPAPLVNHPPSWAKVPSEQFPSKRNSLPCELRLRTWMFLEALRLLTRPEPKTNPVTENNQWQKSLCFQGRTPRISCCCCCCCCCLVASVMSDCATPQTAAHQAPPPLGFSRQEHWNGLLFPSPMHESEKWTWSRSVVSDSSWSHELQPTRLLCPWDFPGKSTGVLLHLGSLVASKYVF